MLRPTAAIRLTALLVTAVYSLVVWASGLAMPWWARLIVSALPTAAVLVTIGWDLFLWRLPGVQRLTRRPDLRGLWRVTLTPTTDSHIPDGGNHGPIDAFLEVRQSYWSIHTRMYTQESASTSTASTWLPTFETDVDSLTFLYSNTPRMKESRRSMRSDGSCSLEPATLKPTEMLGTYFTDRFTKGDIHLKFIDRTTGHASFEAAKRHGGEISDESA